jgi:hypothetical protein
VKITARLTGTAALARLDAERLRIVQRLTAALEREVQTSPPADRARDGTAHPQLTARVASPLRGEGGGP